jgi:ribonuclease HI
VKSAVELWTDGACSGNPGPGGWAAILRRRLRLPAPDHQLSGAAVVAHYHQIISGYEAQGLIVADGQARAVLERASEQLIADSSLEVRVSIDRELSGSVADTTNNRMELLAVVAGFRALARPSVVAVHCDSSYVMNAFVKGWLASWQRRGWKTTAGGPVANQDLWQKLLIATNGHELRWVKVAGHAGVDLNERCDRLAVAARLQLTH